MVARLASWILKGILTMLIMSPNVPVKITNYIHKPVPES
jgi:hypothetical protein